MPTKLALASFYTLSLLVGFLATLFFLFLYFAGVFDLFFLFALVIGINFLAWLIGPWFTSLVHKWLFKMKFLKREEFKAEFPAIDVFIEETCHKHNIKFPRMGVIDDDNPTAYTFGSGAYNARVVITRGLFKYLTEDEVKTVVAHELGHIVHRDFIVMAVANTIIQLFYVIYRVTAKKSSGDSKGKNALVWIGLIAYGFYLIGTYIVLYLNRLRESYADEFSAQTTNNPVGLGNALVKIGYGIVAKEDSGNSKTLMEDTQTLGIMGFKSAKQAGLVAKVTNMEPNKVARVVVYDLVSPWAKLSEYFSTHPLIGNRLFRLQLMAQKMGQTVTLNFQQAVTEANVDHGRLWREFWRDGFFYFLPTIALFGGVIVLGVFNVFIYQDMTLAHFVGAWFALFALAYMIRTLYMFPNGKGSEQPVTIYEMMTDLYASPARGRRVNFQGEVIGRGVPGFAFSEDIMLQDTTGLMYLDYKAGIPIIGDVLFAWRKVQGLLGKPAIAQGWFFRSNSQYVALSSLQIEGQLFKSYVRFWAIAGGLILAVIGSITAVATNLVLAIWYIPFLGLLITYIVLARRNKIKTVADEKKEQELKKNVSGKRILKGIGFAILILIIIFVIVSVLNS